MEPGLPYASPAIEPLLVPPGPPDPPIPAALLAEPSLRRVKVKISTRLKRAIAGWTAVVFFVVCSLGSLADMGVFMFAPVVPATVVSRSMRSNRIDFEYQLSGETLTDSQEVDAGFYDRIRMTPTVPVHAVHFRRWGFAEIDMPWADFVVQRLHFWKAGVIGVVLAAGQLVWRLTWKPIEQTSEAILAIHGVPTFARIIEFGARSSRSSSRKAVYQYFAPGGAPVKVTLWVESIWQIPSRRPGDPMLVIYNPQRPEEHVIYKTLPFTVFLKDARG